MPNSTMSLDDAKKILKLLSNSSYTKSDITKAYRTLAKQYHPDKGGTHEQFLALCEAYQVASDSVRQTTELDNEAGTTTVNVPLSAEEALATLYITISAVREKLYNHVTSQSLALNDLRRVLDEILLELQRDLDCPPQYVVETLRLRAKDINSRIETIYSGPTPVFAATVAFAFLTTSLGILALIIALSQPAGVVLGTAALSGLIAIPPVAGLLFGAICFYGATSADKNRSTQQQEMKKIVTAINALAKVFEDNSEEDDSSLRFNNRTYSVL